jgi:hypothetical protein
VPSLFKDIDKVLKDMKYLHNGKGHLIGFSSIPRFILQSAYPQVRKRVDWMEGLEIVGRRDEKEEAGKKEEGKKGRRKEKEGKKKGRRSEEEGMKKGGRRRKGNSQSQSKELLFAAYPHILSPEGNYICSVFKKPSGEYLFSTLSVRLHLSAEGKCTGLVTLGNNQHNVEGIREEKEVEGRRLIRVSGRGTRREREEGEGKGINWFVKRY